MNIFQKLVGVVLSFTLMTLISGCGGGTSASTGTATVNLTDAPVDDKNVLGVHVGFDAVMVKPAGSGWITEELNETRVINLLDLQDGNSTFISQIELPTGRINQVRFVINYDASFVELVDRNESLNVPSNEEKFVGGFVVPAGGDVNITADFDVRKSLVLSSNGTKYSLKPTIKIVDNSKVGEVSGTVTGIDGNTTVIYAYTDGTWEQETTDDFANAVTSSDATDGDYTLAWLTAGTYDLVVVKFDNNGENPEVLSVVTDVVITEDGKTTQDINL
jgi:hypothetical protein